MPTPPKKQNPVKLHGPETAYGRALRRVAGHVRTLAAGIDPADPSSVHEITEALRKYSETLTPWAKVIAGRMLTDVAKKDRTAWKQIMERLSRALRNELANADSGEILRMLMREQVSLIKSIPLDAAERVHKLVLEGMSQSVRPNVIAQEILRTSDITKARATLIARTETSRAASTLTMARSLSIGSEGYIWRTSEDASVRPSHEAMDGKYVRWDDPPILDHLRGHAGCLPNCRCYPEPVISEN